MRGGAAMLTDATIAEQMAAAAIQYAQCLAKVKDVRIPDRSQSYALRLVPSMQSQRTAAGYFGDTCVTSSSYCELKNAFLRSLVATNPWPGWRSGKNGPVSFSLTWSWR